MEMKRLFVLAVLTLWGTSVTNALADDVPLEIIDEKPAGGGNTKSQPLPLIVTLEGHTLTIPSSGVDYVFQVLSPNGIEYSVYVPAGTTTIIIPASLSGSYEIRLVADTYYYRGYVTL